MRSLKPEVGSGCQPLDDDEGVKVEINGRRRRRKRVSLEMVGERYWWWREPSGASI